MSKLWTLGTLTQDQDDEYQGDQVVDGDTAELAQEVEAVAALVVLTGLSAFPEASL